MIQIRGIHEFGKIFLLVDVQFLTRSFILSLSSPFNSPRFSPCETKWNTIVTRSRYSGSARNIRNSYRGEAVNGEFERRRKIMNRKVV